MDKKCRSRMSGQVGTGIYSKTTVPPAASRAAFSFSASSLDTLARISWGRDSTSFLAWFRRDRQKQSRFNEIPHIIHISMWHSQIHFKKKLQLQMQRSSTELKPLTKPTKLCTVCAHALTCNLVWSCSCSSFAVLLGTLQPPTVNQQTLLLSHYKWPDTLQETFRKRWHLPAPDSSLGCSSLLPL